jgi:hypothetical protein
MSVMVDFLLKKNDFLISLSIPLSISVVIRINHILIMSQTRVSDLPQPIKSAKSKAATPYKKIASCYPDETRSKAKGVFVPTVPCKYGENCNRKDTCTFLHDEKKAFVPTVPCRYGDSCHRKDCSFLHEKKPSGSPHLPIESADLCRHGDKCIRLASGTCRFKHSGDIISRQLATLRQELDNLKQQNQLIILKKEIDEEKLKLSQIESK